MNNLIGKTVFITGGNRGIGYAIALRLAKAGANVAIAAKEELAKKPSASIYAAATEIAKEGVKTLAIDLDVSDAEAIKLAVEKAASHFSGIDILINNVSTFCFTNTLDTSPENLDLLFSVNARSTFLVSRACIPYLKNSTNPHILTISPPLEMEASWFKNHLAFTMSKYAMSMCTLGMAEEFNKAGIAVNSLWPLTTIATTTINEHFLPDVYKGSRFPTIMADAAYELLQKNARTCTGKFFIDEEVLRETGVTQFEQYAVDPSVPLTLDLFIPQKYFDSGNFGKPLERKSFIQQD